MSNFEIQNNDLGSVDLFGTEYESDIYDSTIAGAGTLAAGTILARDSVSGKLRDFVVGGGTNENGIPKVVVGNHEIVHDGSGDVSLRVIVSGEVRRDKIVTAAADTITDAIVDQLRDYSIVARRNTDVSKLDNQ
jgi:hypothetical protein